VRSIRVRHIVAAFPATQPATVTFAALSAGSDHTCAVTAAGAPYCWGFNAKGRLGDGTTAPRWSPVRVAGDVSFAAVSAGGELKFGPLGRGMLTNAQLSILRVRAALQALSWDSSVGSSH